MSRVGLTTTVPVEIIYAAGRVPVDLNNIFITSGDSSAMLEQAEQAGLPNTLCSWVKGMYSAVVSQPDIDTVIAVVEGDCSNVLPLVDIFRAAGRTVVPFSYPFGREREHLRIELNKLMDFFGVSEDSVYRWMERLDGIRRKALFLDEVTWKRGTVTGFENHLWLVNTSDFEGDPDGYERRLDGFLSEVFGRTGEFHGKRLGFVGVPPVFPDLYDFLEARGARVLFNEVQRQFSLPNQNPALLDRFMEYTYPYSLELRLQDIREQVKLRRLDGIVHYTQSFCHHQMEHFMLKNSLNIPVLLLEGDRPCGIDGRTSIRIESFLEMLP